MKKVVLLIAIVFVILLPSCVKDLKYLLPETPEVPDPLNHPLPEIIWHQSLDGNDGEIFNSIDPILHNNLIISSYQPHYSGNEVLLAFDKESGDKIWSWSDFYGSTAQSFEGDEKLYVYNDMLLACSSQDDYAIDLNAGQTIWSSMIEHGSNNMSHFNELLFHTDKSGPYWYSDSSRILMSNIENGQWFEVLTMHKEHSYEVKIDAPGVFIDQNSDMLLLFQVQRYYNPTGDQKVDLYCYNMTQDSVIWYKLDYTDYGFRNQHIPIIDGDRAYISAKEKIHCIDLQSGDFIWSYTPPTIGLDDYQLYNGLFITFLANGDLLALDKFSGSQVYLIEGITSSPSTFSVYEDRLYYSDKYLFILDVNTGDKLYTFQSPNGIDSFYNPPAVDLENNRMFISDKKDLFCLQVPE
jgi:outer membrane protein assembly factor BamB